MSSNLIARSMLHDQFGFTRRGRRCAHADDATVLGAGRRALDKMGADQVLHMRRVAESEEVVAVAVRPALRSPMERDPVPAAVHALEGGRPVGAHLRPGIARGDDHALIRDGIDRRSDAERLAPAIKAGADRRGADDSVKRRLPIIPVLAPRDDAAPHHGADHGACHQSEEQHVGLRRRRRDLPPEQRLSGAKEALREGVGVGVVHAASMPCEG
ncbi:MAG: hypothetical protein JNJ73_08080 [Hyphomonadaceae bacterium]|nr:hypothetical protein [Hyphomonadaceae bacterium]